MKAIIVPCVESLQINAESADVFEIILDKNITLSFDDLNTSKKIIMLIRQDSIGSRTCTFSNQFSFTGNSTITSTANSTSVVEGIIDKGTFRCNLLTTTVNWGDIGGTITDQADLLFYIVRIADFVPGTGAQLDRQWTRYNQYQQTGVLQIDVVDILETGCCTIPIIKTADAITVFVGAVDITTIGKLDGSSDFSTTVGDVDLVTILKLDETTDNTTGVYYSIKNLG